MKCIHKAIGRRIEKGVSSLDGGSIGNAVNRAEGSHSFADINCKVVLCHNLGARPINQRALIVIYG